MPMSFPDLESLKRRAAQREFRQPFEEESEQQYRAAFADFMMGVDRVESAEIRSGLGWDKQEPLSMLGNMLGAEGLKALQSTLRSHYYVGTDDKGFSFDWNNDRIENLISDQLDLLTLFEIQEVSPNNKATFAEIFKRVSAITNAYKMLLVDLEVVQVMLNNGLNEVKDAAE